MRKFLLAGLGVLFLLASAEGALAACTGPAVMHDFPGTSFNMALGQDPSGGCASNVNVLQNGALNETGNPFYFLFGTGATLPAFASPPAVQGDGASGSALAGNPFRVGLSDGTNAQNWLAAIALADGVNGNNTGAVASWLWNGTTYDRAYGDKTDGAWVNVKASALPTGAASATNQTNKAQFTQLTDGTNAATAYTAYGTAPTGNVPGANVFVTNTNANVGGGSPVTNGADNWNTIAASQTSQKLSATSGGTTGATGDYLSHCTVQPTTTAAGTVTIADLTTTIYTFTSGTLSNLVPFTIPVGAISKNGAWEVTTGANVTVTCVGHFS